MVLVLSKYLLSCHSCQNCQEAKLFLKMYKMAILPRPALPQQHAGVSRPILPFYLPYLPPVLPTPCPSLPPCC